MYQSKNVTRTVRFVGIVALSAMTSFGFVGCSDSDGVGLATAPGAAMAPDGAAKHLDCAIPGFAKRVFPFTLPAGSTESVVLGPIFAGPGPMRVSLDFDGDYVILACVGTATACIPMGGHPMSVSFNIPDDLPAGRLQAQVYFNPNFPQPAGDATGTVMFTYSPLRRR